MKTTDEMISQTSEPQQELATPSETVKKKPLLGIVLLFVTALIWGIAFVPQSMCEGLHIGAFTYNGVRSVIGGTVLLPIVLHNYFKRKQITNKHISAGELEPSQALLWQKRDRKNLFTGGVICGILLAMASTAQQLGINSGTSGGKAAFLTTIYIVLVPLTGLFFKRRVEGKIWVSVLLALVGLFFLSVFGEILNGTGKLMQASDLIVVLSAFAFVGHILVIDNFSPKVDGVALSCIQFYTCGLINLPLMFIIDRPSLETVLGGWFPILYAGMISCGIAYTFQVIAQKHVAPTVASLIMSLESVFGAISTWVATVLWMPSLNGKMVSYEICGCLLVFAGVIISQIPKGFFRKIFRRA